MTSLADVAEAAEVEKTVCWRVVSGYRSTKGDTVERAVWNAVAETGWTPAPRSQAERYMTATGRLGVVATVGGCTYRRHPQRGWQPIDHPNRPDAVPRDVAAILDQQVARQ